MRLENSKNFMLSFYLQLNLSFYDVNFTKKLHDLNDFIFEVINLT